MIKSVVHTSDTQTPAPETLWFHWRNSVGINLKSLSSVQDSDLQDDNGAEWIEDGLEKKNNHIELMLGMNRQGTFKGENYDDWKCMGSEVSTTATEWDL